MIDAQLSETTGGGVDADQPPLAKSIADALNGLAEVLQQPEEASFIIGLASTTHVKMRLKSFLFSVDNSGATAVTLKIGAQSYVYNVIGPLTIQVSPPQSIIDRGVDVTCTASAGNVSHAQFRYTAE